MRLVASYLRLREFEADGIMPENRPLPPGGISRLIEEHKSGNPDAIDAIVPLLYDELRRIAAYYFWVFPNLMLNFYPWGLSVNVVQPQGPHRCRVAFRSHVLDDARLAAGAGGALHQVEMEDEAVVQAVQRGVCSRWYKGGRYSPTRERGVHHFHRLLCEFMSDEEKTG